MTEGDWARGERLLTQSLKGSDAPLVHYLFAARAAQQQGCPRASRRVAEARLSRSRPTAEAAVLLTQAELQLDAGELDAALGTLQRLEQLRPEHPGALALARAEPIGPAVRVRSCVALLPRLGRARLTAGATRSRSQLQAFAERVVAARDLTKERLGGGWAASSRASSRRRRRSTAQRALALDRLGAATRRRSELRGALKRTWHPKLVEAYGKVRGPDPAKQLKHAETWLKEHTQKTLAC